MLLFEHLAPRHRLGRRFGCKFLGLLHHVRYYGSKVIGTIWLVLESHCVFFQSMSKKCLDASVFYQPEKEDDKNTEANIDFVACRNDSKVSEAHDSNNEQAGPSNDPSLDVTSENVDWEKCFSQRDVPLPYPDAKLEVDLVEIKSISELTAENVASNCPKPRAAEFSTTKLDRDRKKKQQEQVAKSKQTRETAFEKSSNSNILFFNTHRHGPQALLYTPCF